MTKVERGDAVARAVWTWLQKAKCVELVPWVTDPQSPDYDLVEASAQIGRKKVLAELEHVITMASRGETCEP